jgi:hypothetical protein
MRSHNGSNDTTLEPPSFVILQYRTFFYKENEVLIALNETQEIIRETCISL